MGQTSSTESIDRALAAAGIMATIEESQGRITLIGRVNSEGSRQAAQDIVSAARPEVAIDNQLEVEIHYPELVGHDTSDEPSMADLPDSLEEIRERGADIAPDFTDQQVTTDATIVAGSRAGARESEFQDAVDEGEIVFVPPTDPVVTVNRHGQPQVLGGFQETSMDETGTPRSASDGQIGDEAIADAVRRELREDAATTDLDLVPYVRQGVVHLRGKVATVQDAESAEEVASRVEGVREVIDETELVS